MTGRAVRRALLPTATGVLLAAATPPAASPLVPFVALVPLALHLRGLSGDDAPLAALRAGAIAGLIQHAWGLRWLPFTLSAIAGPAIGSLAFAAVLAVLAGATGAAAWGAHRIARSSSSGAGLAALPLAWVALEWTLARLPLGLAFPWAPLGLGLASWPEALGPAELVGMTGVTAWLASVSALFAAGLAAPTVRRRVALGGAALVLAGAPVLWGTARARELDAADGPTAGVLVALSLPARAGDRTDAGVAAAERVVARLVPGAADLIALPEMVLPVDGRSPEGAAASARLARASAAAGAPMLVGSLRSDDRGAYNSVLLIDAAGPGAFHADKRRLVPGVERAAATRAAWLAPVVGGYAEGTGRAVASVGSLRAGVLVCYEVAFGEDVRALARDGAGVLVALTSDAWFRGGEGARRAGVSQQTAHLVARAVETRLPAARAAEGGPAVIVAPSGRELARTDAPGAASARVPVRSGATPSTRWGDRVGPTATAAFLVLVVGARRRADRLANWKT